MGADAWALALAFALVIAVGAAFAAIGLRVRRRGGSLVTTTLGATHELLTAERRRAGEVILSERSGEREDDDESGDPEEPDGTGQ